jgi:hypothetical protein
MPGHSAEVTLHQIALLRGAKLEVKLDGHIYRILTKNWAEVETLHRIVPDPNHSPSFINGDFRIYKATLTRP